MAYEEEYDPFVIAMGSFYCKKVTEWTEAANAAMAFINKHFDENTFNECKDDYQENLHASMRIFVNLRKFGGANYRGSGHSTLNKFLLKNCFLYILLNKTFQKIFGDPLNGIYFGFTDLYKYTNRIFPPMSNVVAAFEQAKEVAPRGRRKVARRVTSRGMMTPPSSDDEESDGDIDIAT